MTFVLSRTLLSCAGQVVSLQEAPNSEMKSQPRFRRLFMAVLLLTGLLSALGLAQSAPRLLATTDARAVVRSVRLVPGPAVEILSSRPLVPTINNLDNPPR